MVFAYHTEDPVSSMEMKQHSFKGARSILLFSELDSRGNVDKTGWTKFTMTARNVSDEK